MNTFDSTSASDVMSQYRAGGQGGEDEGNTNKADDLGRNEFMELMLAQLNNQDPLEPQENGDFIAQLAQFSSLEEMQKLTGTVDEAMGKFRSTQALQASAMVGQSVLVEGDTAKLGPDGEVKGTVELPASTPNLTVSIHNSNGDLVKRMDLGQQSGGETSFTWDGENEDGELMPPGDYQISAEGQFDGENEELTTQVNANVDSVSLEDDGSVTLNLAGRGSVPLDDVGQIN